MPIPTGRNLAVQGYRLGDGEVAAGRVALRFSTGLCLPLVAAAVVAQSAAALAALAGVAALAGWTARHPFDHLWNRVVRRVAGGPPVPPTPRRRSHAFKAATLFLAADAVLAAGGHRLASYALTAVLVGMCLVQTTTYWCAFSEALAIRERRRARVRPAEGRASRASAAHDRR